MRYLVGLLVAMLVAVTFSTKSYATPIDISPVSMTLGRQSSSSVLTLKNSGNEAVRMQASVYAWKQSVRGEPVLTPTQDIAIFPTLLTIEPQQTRRLRVGTMVDFAPTEKTYRVIIEELPRITSSTPESFQAGVQMLSKFSIPLFLEADQPRFAAHFTDPKLVRSTMTASLENVGTTHFMLRSLHVRARGEDGSVVFEGEAAGWYMLPSGTRIFEFTLPKGGCKKIKQVELEGNTDRKPLVASLPPAVPIACDE